MAAGDGTDAAAAGMDLVGGSTPANTIDTELIKTRDYIAQGKMKDGVLLPAKIKGTVPISKGGTGATTEAGARTNLHIVAHLIPSNPTSNVQADLDYLGNTALYPASRITPGTFPGGAFTFPGQMWAGTVMVPGASRATGPATLAYIDFDGRLAKGAPAARIDELLATVAELVARVAALEAGDT